MPKYINADEFKDFVNKKTTPSGASWICARVDEFSPADVVKVTRCKNCVHGIKQDCVPSKKAKAKCICDIDQKSHIENFYCADGTPSIPYLVEETKAEMKRRSEV